MVFSNKLFVLATLLLNASVFVNAQAAGSQNVGLKNGSQFITGQCTSDADCASTCCVAKTGLCGAVGAQLNGRADCGFGGSAAPAAAAPAPDNAAAAAPAASGPNESVTPQNQVINPSAPGAQSVGLKNGQQFITGQCTSDADCASGCCGFHTGLCAGAVIAQTRDGGCGFGNTSPNNNAAVALLGPSAPAPAGAAAAPAAAPDNAAAAAPAASGPNESVTPQNQVINPSLPGAQSVGLKNGAQFITGQCTSDADCASGCCGFHSGLCAGAVIAQTRDGGCGFGDAQPNNNAEQKLQGRRYVKKSLLYGH